MKKVEIIQSSQEPSPFNLWLNGDVLKKYTASGWKSISSDDEKFYSKTEIDNKLIEYDATHKDLSDGIKKLNTSLDTLVNGESVTEAIDSYKEIEAFLQGITNTETLTGLLKDVSDSIKEDTASKYVNLTDAQNIEGIKTFASNIITKGNILFSSSTSNGKITQSNYGINIYGGNASGTANYIRFFGSSTDSSYVLQIKSNTPLQSVHGYAVPKGTSSQFLKADGSVDDTEYLSEIPDNVVTTDDVTQYIYGTKYFNNSVYFNNVALFNLGVNISRGNAVRLNGNTTLYESTISDRSRIFLCAENDSIHFRTNGAFSTKNEVTIDTDGIVTAEGFSISSGYFNVDKNGYISTIGAKIGKGTDADDNYYLDVNAGSDFVNINLYNGYDDSQLTPSLRFNRSNIQCWGEFLTSKLRVLNGKSTQFLKADGSLDETIYAKGSLFTEVGYLSNGSLITSNTNYLSTDFIYINKDYPIKYTSVYFAPSSSDKSICFYDKDKNYISGITGNTDIAIKTVEIEDIPEDAVYVRVTTRVSSTSYFYNGPASQANNADIISAITESLQEVKDAIPSSVINRDDSIAEIEPNVLNVWGEVTTLNITLKEPVDTGRVNEYMIEFISGNTPTVLTLPDSVKFVTPLEIEANKCYQISIVNNIGVIAATDMSAFRRKLLATSSIQNFDSYDNYIVVTADSNRVVLTVNNNEKTYFVNPNKPNKLEIKEDVTSLENFMENAINIKEVDLSNLDISKVTSLYRMFAYCSVENLNLNFDTSNIDDFVFIFYRALNIKSIDISNWDLSRATNVSGMFGDCFGLTNLKFGKNLKLTLNLSTCPLTHESALSVLNGLAEITTNQIVYFLESTYETLTEEDIAIATSKGWKLVSVDENHIGTDVDPRPSDGDDWN